MTVFADIQTRQPSSHLVLPPNAFADAWEGKPREEVCAGLRLISEADMNMARAQAAAFAKRSLPETEFDVPQEVELWTDCFNSRLIALIASRVLCDPNDVQDSFDLFKAAPEDMCCEYLTSEGLKLIFDAWEKMRIVLDPTQREASDATCESISTLFVSFAKDLAPHRIQRVRRLLAFVADELTPDKSEQYSP